MIYITFVLLFIFIKKISNISYLTEKEKQINFLEISGEAVLKGNEAYEILLSRSVLERIETQKVFPNDSDKTSGDLDEMPDLPPPSSLEPRIYTTAKIS
ncbi:hypothetical protein [Methanosarcina horonobensis]|uniref:hypothetical protein n=1 Tax=Methanosarcina horonobensis TaxID=418008 RepID=UPI000AD2C74C|nr:hypothetical protein [Methanosarcina horonobensis]